MYKTKKREYTSPTIELFEVRVEKGFLGSKFETTDNPQGLSDYQDGGDKTTFFT